QTGHNQRRNSAAQPSPEFRGVLSSGRVGGADRRPASIHYLPRFRMKRRTFITLTGLAAVWPLAARAQRPRKLPTIGILGGATEATWSAWLPALIRRLAELGWIEGRTVTIEYRWAAGSPERAAEQTAELVQLNVDVIVTAGGVLAAVKRATSTTPIVFAVATDPVGSGFAASLARPGGNLTGLSLQTTDHAAKRVELLAELVPTARNL